MKENAPEKIYIQSFNVSEEDVKFDKSKMFFDDVWTEEPESGQENIEYIRTDAFIKKINKWLPLNMKMLMNVLDVEYSTHDTDIKDFIEDFIRYIKD